MGIQLCVPIGYGSTISIIRMPQDTGFTYGINADVEEVYGRHDFAEGEWKTCLSQTIQAESIQKVTGYVLNLDNEVEVSNFTAQNKQISFLSMIINLDSGKMFGK